MRILLLGEQDQDTITHSQWLCLGAVIEPYLIGGEAERGGELGI